MATMLDNGLLAHIKDLDLRAKIIAQGALQGHHVSRLRGTGIEFSQFRSYEPGDELSKIDWKLFARSDRYFVREAERESQLNIWAVIDCSASMQEASQSGAIDKFNFAKMLLSACCYLAHQQGDGVGMLGTAREAYLPARNTQQHYYQCLLKINDCLAGGGFPSIDFLQAQLQRLQSNALTLIVTDYYQQAEEITGLVERLKGHNTDVISIQLETADEAQFNYSGLIEFTERETGAKRKVDADAIKQSYLANRQRFNDKIANQLSARGIQHFRINIDEPIERSLRHLLLAMQSAGARGL